MKFAEHLLAHITPEWRKQYINYEEMKAMLYAAVEQAPSAELVEPDILQRYFTTFDENFFHYCDKELTKINTFYSEKLAEATRKYANLSSELSEAQDDDFKDKRTLLHHGRKILGKKTVPAKKTQEMKLAFSEYYLSLILLQNYQTLNFTGFRKILKKHDKLLTVDGGARWRLEHVETSHFHTSKDIDRLIRETEATVTQELESGDRQRAMKRLRVPPLGEQQSPWTTFKVGLFCGALAVLLLAVALSALFRPRADDWRIACRLYRAPLLVVQFLFLWGVNIYGWRSAGVNHVLIFEMDPRSHLSDQHLIELAAVFGVVWSASVLCFLYSSALAIPAYVNPLALALLMAAFLFNPTRTLRHEARFWALRVLGRVLAAPFCYVTFADFWVADQLNSLGAALADLQYLCCFYLTNPGWHEGADANHCVRGFPALRALVRCLPGWFRFAQCLRRYRDTREARPHLANAAKYSTTFLVAAFSGLMAAHAHEHDPADPAEHAHTTNPYFYPWLASSLLSSCYAYTWDVKLDWGLLDARAGDNRFLREEIVYPCAGLYYFGIVEDLVLRFSWAFGEPLIELGYVQADVMVSVLAPLEVFRRFVWNFFRLENEHLNNCGKFRAVRDISVAPISCSDQLLILRLMDDEDGGGGGAQERRARRPRLTLEGESTDDPDS